MSERLFDPDLVYPCSNGGRYIDLTGTIIEAADWHADLGLSAHTEPIRVKVKTEKGDFTGYWDGRPSRLICYWDGPPSRLTRMPKVGGKATIRIYDSGGGWYPDNEIVTCELENESAWEVETPEVARQPEDEDDKKDDADG